MGKHNNRQEARLRATRSALPDEINHNRILAHIRKNGDMKRKNERRLFQQLKNLIFSPKIEHSYYIRNVVIIFIMALLSHWLLNCYKNYVTVSLIYSTFSEKFGYDPIRTNISLQEEESDLFWGTYRPGHYLGIKHRSEHSLLAGIAWLQNGNFPPKLRHSCVSQDNIIYNWLQHDGRHFGNQEIIDGPFTLYTKFLKRKSLLYSSKVTFDWSLRISLESTHHDLGGSPFRHIQKSKNTTSVSDISFIVYFFMPQHEGARVTGKILHDKLQAIDGVSPEIGSFRVSFNQHNDSVSSSYLMTDCEMESKIEECLMRGLGFNREKKRFTLLNNYNVQREGEPPHRNLIALEVTMGIKEELEVIFTTSSGEKSTLKGTTFDALWKERRDSFDRKFEEKFLPLNSRYSRREIQLGKAILSNVLGGIGYFHGRSLIKSDYFTTENHVLPYAKLPMFTATPSRDLFPRGFLWDEGFHQLVISRWDVELSLDCIAHWLNTMNAEGWIPREQILGDEAVSRVPEDFLIQHHKVGNPPTLILPLVEMMLRSNNDEMEAHKPVLKAMLPRLKAWFHWFNETQQGTFSSSYRWHGRNPNSTLTLNSLTLSSGLDDYPRASHPTNDERHLDLRCWMSLFSRLIITINNFVVNRNSSVLSEMRDFEEWSKVMHDESKLNELHWNEEKLQYSDYGLHTDHISFTLDPAANRKVRHVHKQPTEQYLPFTGYVNLFPVLLQVLDNKSQKLSQILKDMSNSSQLWSDFGVRSLSKTDTFYRKFNTETDPPYWRGQIWMNMNYLAVHSLKHYSSTSALAAELHEKLSDNLIRNVLKQYNQTGYLWEQYNDFNGRGQRGHPFSGWTSLILLIMVDSI